MTLLLSWDHVYAFTCICMHASSYTESFRLPVMWVSSDASVSRPENKCLCPASLPEKKNGIQKYGIKMKRERGGRCKQCIKYYEQDYAARVGFFSWYNDNHVSDMLAEPCLPFSEWICMASLLAHAVNEKYQVETTHAAHKRKGPESLWSSGCWMWSFYVLSGPIFFSPASNSYRWHPHLLQLSSWTQMHSRIDCCVTSSVIYLEDPDVHHHGQRCIPSPPCSCP